MSFFFWFSFVLSMFGAMLYQQYELDLHHFFRIEIGIGVLMSYILSGMIIEYGKNMLVRFSGKHYFKGIDDVVDLSFAAALGFTFYENAIYFIALFSTPMDYGVPVSILKEVLNREFFILPIHLFCSGIFGYYYGLSIFASNEYEQQVGFMFRRLQVLKGTLISTLTYGLFFMLREMDPSLRDVMEWFGIINFPINEKIMPLVSFGFFSLGTLFLFHKMEQIRFIVTPPHKYKL